MDMLANIVAVLEANNVTYKTVYKLENDTYNLISADEVPQQVKTELNNLTSNKITYELL